MVNMGSFDTHSNQVDASDHTTGNHATLLQQLSDAIAAFFDDCKLLQVDSRVAAMTFSEFGRRIISNGSLGTDHGTSEPVMVFGNGVNPGFIGENPQIPQNATDYDNLGMQNDFRSVYAAVLADWFEVPASVMSDVLLQNFEVLPIFNKNYNGNANSNNEALSQNFPNPFSQSTTIRFISQGGLVTILLYDLSGQIMRTITNQVYTYGSYEIVMARNELIPGNYLCKLYNGSHNGMKQMTVTG